MFFFSFFCCFSLYEMKCVWGVVASVGNLYSRIRGAI